MITSSQPASTRRSSASSGAWLARMLLLALLGVLPLTARAAPKTDVVVLVNGDRITGEIKSLEYNQLKLSTYHMGTIYIEWDKIVGLQTDQYLLLERTDGTRYYGQLVAGEKSDSMLRVKRDADQPLETVEMAVIVRAQPIEGGRIVERLEGYVSAGLDIAKANSRSSIDFAGGLSSRTRVHAWSIAR